MRGDVESYEGGTAGLKRIGLCTFYKSKAFSYIFVKKILIILQFLTDIRRKNITVKIKIGDLLQGLT